MRTICLVGKGIEENQRTVLYAGDCPAVVNYCMIEPQYRLMKITTGTYKRNVNMVYRHALFT